MTIGAIVGLIVLGIICVFIPIGAFLCADNRVRAMTIAIVVALALFFSVSFGLRWYYTSTANGQRALTDERSNLSGGIERGVDVYTANGELLARHEGKIDLDTNDGGYVKFDFEGHRYIYYNCFVETIAEIP